ncbi:uncharacterized protein TA10445 [Theileria annulata]|uniref:Uncharacterized protein n=1 Tax=Theileria annulata TaxID=5874 RepID=Q4U8Z1_THEAN|nr:uncharacterized protein TA10445 [Theileria annulata]CAI76712.1 hypothetical protein TA10445 [Theileria annulata]|eukprot:XP_953337.1 hypothetical protein TA10445 [Theileria annulata]
MFESSENSNTTIEVSDESSKPLENPPNDTQPQSEEKGLLTKLDLEKLAERLTDVGVKPKVTFDDEKWSKICKITRNILLANIKQYNNDSYKRELSSSSPVILSHDLKVPSDHTPALPEPSIELWNLNILEFISLSSGCKRDGLNLSFKIVESTHYHHKFPDHPHGKHKVMNKLPPITIQGKQFKYDSAQLISMIQKSQRYPMYEKSMSELKGRVLEKYNLKGEVKIPPNWEKRVGYETSNWDMPSSCNTGSIFSLGSLKNDKKASSDPDIVSANNALKNLSCLVPGFQYAKKTQPEGSSEDVTQMNISDINNFSFVDDDVDDSLKCSRFSKFFKVLKDHQVQTYPTSTLKFRRINSNHHHNLSHF